MAIKNSTIVWLSVTGLALLGGGAFLLYRRKKLRSQIGAQPSIESSQSPETNKASNQNQSDQGNPIGNSDAVKAFQSWVNQYYAAGLSIDGQFGPKTKAQWEAHGKQYTSGSNPNPTAFQPGGNGWQTIQNQILNKNVWGNNMRLSESSATRLRYGLDVDGFYDVYTNFASDGGFWMEKIGKAKVQGAWSFKDGVFTLKLNNGSLNAQDSDIADLTKTAIKLAFPDEMKYYSFDAGSKLVLHKTTMPMDAQAAIM